MKKLSANNQGRILGQAEKAASRAPLLKVLHLVFALIC